MSIYKPRVRSARTPLERVHDVRFDPEWRSARFEAGRRRQTVALAWFVGCLFLLIPAAAQASTFEVTLTSDAAGTCQPAGPCTLRQAIASARDGDTVSVSPGTYQLSAAAGGTIAIGASITVAGPNGGAANTVIDGQSSVRIFALTGKRSVTFQDLTLAHGQSGDTNGGSALLAPQYGETVRLTRVVLDHNSNNVNGGAIEALGATLNLVDVAFSHNHAHAGGGLYTDGGQVSGNGVLFEGNDTSNGNGGGIYADSTGVSLQNATFAANAATGAGGGAIYAFDALTTLTNVTFALDNSASGALGGNDVFNTSAGGVSAVNTIFGSGGSGSACAGAELGTMSNDVAVDDSCTAATSIANQLSADPRLMALANYGGPTDTIAILPSSPAIHAGDPASCPPSDERGVSRTGGCDIGAFQRQPADPAPPYTRTQPASNIGDSSATLNAVVNPSGQDTSYYFQYGTGGGFANSTTPIQLTSSGTDQTVSADVGGLSPASNYQFRVIATNRDGRSDASSQAFTTQANQPPSCAGDSVSVDAGSSVTLPLSCVDPDGETVTRSIISQPGNGTLGQIDQTAGTVTYTAPSGYSGRDSVTFEATDRFGAASAPASVTIDVRASGTPPPPPPAPGCTVPVNFGLIEAHGCFTQSSGEYITTGRATVNGLAITPDDGSSLILDPAKNEVWTSGTAAVAIGPFTLYDGGLDWLAPAPAPAAGANVAQFDPNHKVVIQGFPIAGHVTLSLTQGGASAELALRLPDAFNGLTGQSTLQTTEAHGFSLSSLQLAADDLVVGPVRLDNVVLNYSADTDTWQGGATVYLPTPNMLGIIGGLSLHHGQFQSATAGVDDLNVPLANGLFLQRIQLSLAVNPLDIGGGIAISVGPVLPLGGASDVTKAPKPGEEAVRVDGNFDWRFSNPWRLHVDGAVKLVDANLASAYFDYLSTGSMDFGGKLELGLPDTADPDHQPVYLAATLNGWIDGSRAFDAEAAAVLRVMGADIAGAQLLVSNLGISACGQLGWLQAGFGYRWADHAFALMGPWSCDVGGYRPAPASPAAAGTRLLRFGNTAQTEIIRLVGAGAPPKLSLYGPGGQHVSTTPDGRPVINGRFVVLTDHQSNTTYIAIRHAAGMWKLSLADRSVIRSLGIAATLPAPRISASVRGRGQSRSLRYTIRAQPGDRVQFAEVAKATHRVLGTVPSGVGRLRFTPGNGAPGVRRIVAIVIRNGLPQSEHVVARYLASRPPRPAPPTAVHVRRVGSALIVTWRPARGRAEGYAVRLAIHDGATRLRYAPAGKTQLQISGVLATDAGTITVAGIGQDGRPGPSARARLLAGRG